MPDSREIVIDTGPLIALIAALGNLDVLKCLYSRVIIPFEVCREIQTDNSTRFGVMEFTSATWLEKRTSPIDLSPFLRNVLDPGEASVIQIAINEQIPFVAIDETFGRRIARLHGLQLTGSLGILIKSKRHGYSIDISNAIRNMRNKGIWINANLEAQIIKETAKQ